MKRLFEHTSDLGLRIQVECERGLFNGRIKIWYPSGNLFLDGHYVDGVSRAKNIWYDNETQRSCHYNEDMVEGEYIQFVYYNDDEIESSNIQLLRYINMLVDCKMLKFIHDGKELAKKEYANEI
jgi:antitoxin component YwqK of YwqJK toxin-antitoxin module